MVILESTITTDDISLESDIPFSKLVLKYGKYLENTYILNGLNTTQITVQKTDLELTTLVNIYFIIEISDDTNDTASISLYTIDVENVKEVKNYNALNLKTDLDNLNFYSGVLTSLDTKLDFLAANDVFINYINYLENIINGNNFLNSIGK